MNRARRRSAVVPETSFRPQPDYCKHNQTAKLIRRGDWIANEKRLECGLAHVLFELGGEKSGILGRLQNLTW